MKSLAERIVHHHERRPIGSEGFWNFELLLDADQHRLEGTGELTLTSHMISLLSTPDVANLLTLSP